MKKGRVFNYLYISYSINVFPLINISFEQVMVIEQMNFIFYLSNQNETLKTVHTLL
jgi:hypothetical protein